MDWHWNRATHSNRSMENTDMAKVTDPLHPAIPESPWKKVARHKL